LILFSSQIEQALCYSFPSTPSTLFNFTDKTKMIYTAASTEEAIPEALGNGTQKEERSAPLAQPSPSPNGLDSNKMAI
jgi:hypothetical protein